MQHKTISLADQVFEQIENDILSEVYKKGEILTESKLSAALGVSRTPIREALRRLEQEHLIEESGKGAVVIGITEDDLEDIFLIRSKLEGLICKIAATNHTDEDLSNLKEIVDLQEYYAAKGDPDGIRQMDNKFHEMLYKISGKTVFYEILVSLHKKIQKYRRAAVTNKSRAAASVAEHKAIYEAIASSDADKAYELSLKHIENAFNHIKRT
ncbi:MAG: GntR family transcriptional regulator [Clostridia bacterium]|nr:GntR family transcriptional regulator [Clostridia bacterium]